ncbi:hypothetical protein D1V58_03345 [Salmonella enterica]|nr:hypothetical protein [Salmonella enterica]EBQ9194826.1 hypothetical protein [Salmonella enterica subsp. enterica serovar Roodepoort]
MLSGFQKQASLVFENQAPACRLCDCLPDGDIILLGGLAEQSDGLFWPLTCRRLHIVHASARSGRWLYD